MPRDFDLSVYFVVDPSLCGVRAVGDVVRAAVEGGVKMVQFRNKRDDADAVAQQARAIMDVLAPYDVCFLMNDYVDIAVDVGADGVHIGQGDMDFAGARQMMGDDMVLGLTAFQHSHYARIDPDMVDYVGTGPVFPTKTDKGKPVLGIAGFKAVIEHAPVPVVGIGGITPDNAAQVIAAGADGVAMMRGMSEADDVYEAARSYVRAVEKGRGL